MGHSYIFYQRFQIGRKRWKDEFLSGLVALIIFVVIVIITNILININFIRKSSGVVSCSQLTVAGADFADCNGQYR